MLYRVFGVACCLCAAAPSGWADVTVRYLVQTKASTGVGTTQELIVQMQGGRTFTRMGDLGLITDSTKGEATYFLMKTKQVATSSVAEARDRFWGSIKTPPVPPDVQAALAVAKVDVQADAPVSAPAAQGMAGEMKRITATLRLPSPQGGWADFRIVMNTTSATREETDRNAGLKEYASMTAHSAEVLDPAGILYNTVARMGAFGAAFQRALAQFPKPDGVPILRQELVLSMSTDTPARTIGSIDCIVELKELSTAAIPGASFEVPAGLQPVPTEQLLAAMQLPVGNGVYRVGGGISSPKLVHKMEPEYTEEARAAGVQGTVRLYIVVGEDGTPRDFRVLSGLGTGLDEKAIEAVKMWRWEPGRKEGKPVAVAATVEVNFRLLDKPKK